MNTRNTRREFVGVARGLLALMVLFVLGATTQSPAFGATQFDRPIANSGHREAKVSSCLKVKVLRKDQASFHFPSCWNVANYMEESTMTTVIAFLSNQPMHQPCKTTHSGSSTTVRCGFPVKTLKPGGVLVTFIEGGSPGWTIAKVIGNRLYVDHHAAEEMVITNRERSLDATVEFYIFIDRGVPDNYYEFNVYFRNPGVAQDQRLLQKMLNTMKIQ